jgi:hypothetical protein
MKTPSQTTGITTRSSGQRTRTSDVRRASGASSNAVRPARVRKNSTSSSNRNTDSADILISDQPMSHEADSSMNSNDENSTTSVNHRISSSSHAQPPVASRKRTRRDPRIEETSSEPFVHPGNISSSSSSSSTSFSSSHSSSSNLNSTVRSHSFFNPPSQFYDGITTRSRSEFLANILDPSMETDPIRPVSSNSQPHILHSITTRSRSGHSTTHLPPSLPIPVLPTPRTSTRTNRSNNNALNEMKSDEPNLESLRGSLSASSSSFSSSSSSQTSSSSSTDSNFVRNHASRNARRNEGPYRSARGRRPTTSQTRHMNMQRFSDLNEFSGMFEHPDISRHSSLSRDSDMNRESPTFRFLPMSISISDFDGEDDNEESVLSFPHAIPLPTLGPIVNLFTNPSLSNILSHLGNSVSVRIFPDSRSRGDLDSTIRDAFITSQIDEVLNSNSRSSEESYAKRCEQATGPRKLITKADPETEVRDGNSRKRRRIENLNPTSLEPIAIPSLNSSFITTEELRTMFNLDDIESNKNNVISMVDDDSVSTLESEHYEKFCMIFDHVQSLGNSFLTAETKFVDIQTSMRLLAHINWDFRVSAFSSTQDTVIQSTCKMLAFVKAWMKRESEIFEWNMNGNEFLSENKSSSHSLPDASVSTSSSSSSSSSASISASVPFPSSKSSSVRTRSQSISSKIKDVEMSLSSSPLPLWHCIGNSIILLFCLPWWKSRFTSFSDPLFHCLRYLTDGPLRNHLIESFTHFTPKQLLTVTRRIQHSLNTLMYSNMEIADREIGAVHFLSLLRDAVISKGINVNTQKFLGDDNFDFTAFENDAVNTIVNLQEDWHIFTKNKNTPNVYEFSFCKFSFILNSKSKARIAMKYFETDQLTSFIRLNTSSAASLLSNPYLIMNVRRSHLVVDTLHTLSAMIIAHGTGVLKRQLKVHFANEEGVDGGGLRKEWFQLLISQLFDASYGMFEKDDTTGLYWFTSHGTDSIYTDSEMLEQYSLIGTLLGLAVYNRILLPISFPQVLYDKLLRRSLNFDDLKRSFPQIGNSLQIMLDFEETPDLSFEDTFHTVFAVNERFLDTTLTYELCPGGSKKLVNVKNRDEYVRLYTNWKLNLSVERVFDAFARGFDQLIDRSKNGPLALMNGADLELLICGSPELNFKELESTAVYEDFPIHYSRSSSNATHRESSHTTTTSTSASSMSRGVTVTDLTSDDNVSMGTSASSSSNPKRQHIIISHLWEILNEFTAEQKKRFLFFVTGTDRAPVGGLSEVRLRVVNGGRGDLSNTASMPLPSSRTCFATLVLPLYPSKQILKEKLLIAIENAEGFGMR